MKKRTQSAGLSRHVKPTKVNVNAIREYVKSPGFKKDAKRSEAFGPDPSEQDLIDVPPLTEEQWQSMGRSAPKVQLTIRLDADILNWLRAQSGPYQTRINGILRHYMSAAQQVRS